MISKAITIKKIVEYDNNISKELKESKEKLQLDKDKLEKRKEALSELSKDSDNKLAALKENKKQQEGLLVQAKEQERLLASKDKPVKRSNPINKISAGGNFSNNDVLGYATQFLGTPYLWGGTSTAGFDCSGFTQYVYAHFGVSLGRTTYDQINDGPSISKSDLKPGDLVFFGTIDNPHHMGIYMGDNYYIHAPRTGDVVKISSMTRSDFIKGVRVR